MKKIILSLVLLALISCSNDDGVKDPNIPITPNSITAEYTITEIVRPDGSIVPYGHQCAMLKDYMYFDFTKIWVYTYNPNCENYSIYVCDTYYVIDKRITGCNYILDGTISEFTGQRMRIDYDEVITSNNFNNGIGDVKGLILVRR